VNLTVVTYFLKLQHHTKFHGADIDSMTYVSGSSMLLIFIMN
jgi:hypothetical protein